MESKEESISLFELGKMLSDREKEILSIGAEAQLKTLSKLENDLLNPNISTDNLKRIRRVILDITSALKCLHIGRPNLNFHEEGNYEIAVKRRENYQRDLNLLLERCEIRLSNRAERETKDLEYIIRDSRILVNFYHYFKGWDLTLNETDFKKLFCLDIEPIVFPKFKKGGQQVFCYFLSLLKNDKLLDLTDDQIKERFGFNYKSVMQRVRDDNEKLGRDKIITPTTRTEIDSILYPKTKQRTT